MSCAPPPQQAHTCSVSALVAAGGSPYQEWHPSSRACKRSRLRSARATLRCATTSLTCTLGSGAFLWIFTCNITICCLQTEWREDLKKFTRLAGGDGVPCVFLFSDSQIKQESFVEDINNLLNSGEVSGGVGRVTALGSSSNPLVHTLMNPRPCQVPNMFPYDERAAVLEQCRNSSKKEGLGLESAVELWNYFVDKTREVRQS